MLTTPDKKRIFLERYAQTYNKGQSMQGLFTYRSFYIWVKKDPDFAQAIEDVEMRLVDTAEQKYYDLLNSENEKIVLQVATKILNSKLGKKYSDLVQEDKSKIKITGDKIEYIINEN